MPFSRCLWVPGGTVHFAQKSNSRFAGNGEGDKVTSWEHGHAPLWLSDVARGCFPCHVTPHPQLSASHWSIHFCLTSSPPSQTALQPYYWNASWTSSNSCSKSKLQVHFAYPNSRGCTEQKGLSFTRKPYWFEIVISISCKTFAKHFPAPTLCQSCFMLSI